MKRRSGFGFYLLLILMVIFLWYFFSGQNAPTMSMSQLKNALAKEQVKFIRIEQNVQVPTGTLNVNLKTEDASKKVTYTIYVSDVNEAIKTIESYDFEQYMVMDVPQDSWFTEMLPMLLVVAALFILFMIMMNGQAAGGGGGANSRMMNFGPCRPVSVSAAAVRISAPTPGRTSGRTTRRD